MAYNTLQDALNALTSTPVTTDGLLNLVRQTSIQTDGAVTLLYSGPIGDVHSADIVGGMIANGDNIRVIDKSPAGELLASREFRTKVADAFGITLRELDDPKYRGPATDWLYDSKNSPWAEASARFVSATTGEIQTLTGAADPTRIFSQTELPALLSNPNVTSINGITSTDLVRLKSELLASGSTDIAASRTILDYINTASVEQTRALTLATDAGGNLTGIGTKDYFTKIGLSGMGTDLPAGTIAYSPLMQQAPEILGNAKLANDHLQQYAKENLALAEVAGDSTKIASAARYLGKLGFAGAILDVGLMVNDANAAYMAGDTPAANKIVGDWAISAVAGSAASAAALAATSALAATAGLNLAGPVGTAANFAIAALAGVAGGIYGPEVVSNLLNTLDPSTAVITLEGRYRFSNGVERGYDSGITITGGAISGSNHWTIPGADGVVTQIDSNFACTRFAVTQKSDNTPNATTLKRGEISIDADGVHNTTFNKDGWTTVTTDPATRQITSNSSSVIQTDGNTLETVTYANGRIVRIATDLSGKQTQEIVPTATESFISTTATLIDAMSLIKAIQTGQPLPIVASGLRLANDLTSVRVLKADGSSYLKPTNASINGASNVAGGVLSLMSLDAALKRGDSMAAITAGAQAISYSASAYASFGGTFSSTTASSINSLNTALPYLNIVNSIVHGDAVGAAMGAIAMTPAAPVAWAYYAFNMIDSLFSSSEAPPEAWGSAHAQWSGFTATSSTVGGFGGLEAANQTYGSMLSYLDQLAAQQQTLNPGSSIGVIANRLPGLSYRNYSGYQITDIDPLTGVQVNPDIKYDLTGRPYNAPAGSVQASQSLTERMIRVAVERGAIAPSWEVQTAALQTLAGDPMAGLTEEERAGRAGLLASQLVAGASTQTFRAVALDLNGDGVQTTGANKTVAFDVDNSGYLKNTAWLSNADGFLFLDRNLNGQIDAGNELFSNSAVSLTARGLNGMRWVDSNYDGKLSALDPVWNELKVWQDANGNGAADAGEVQTLGTLGIGALDYAMGTFTQNGQLKQLASPDLAADTSGTRTHVVPEGIIIQSSQGQTSLLVTRVDDKSLLEANRDGITSYEDTETLISVADLLANDTLAGLSGQNLSITGVSGFTHGTGFLDGNGYIHYTPEANYFGAANDAMFEMRRVA